MHLPDGQFFFNQPTAGNDNNMQEDAGRKEPPSGRHPCVPEL